LERILQNPGLEFVVESIPSCADFALGAPAMMGSLREFTMSNDIGNSAREKKCGYKHNPIEIEIEITILR